MKSRRLLLSIMIGFLFFLVQLFYALINGYWEDPKSLDSKISIFLVSQPLKSIAEFSNFLFETNYEVTVTLVNYNLAIVLIGWILMIYLITGWIKSRKPS